MKPLADWFKRPSAPIPHRDHRITHAVVETPENAPPAPAAHRSDEPRLREVLPELRAVLGEEHHATVRAKHELGIVCAMRNKYSEAESLLREALAGKRKIFGEWSRVCTRRPSVYCRLLVGNNYGQPVS